MKKLITFVLCCFMLVACSSCVMIPVSLNIKYSTEEITSIEIYYFEESFYFDQGWEREEIMEDGSSEWVSYEGGPIAYVQEEDYAQFISDIKALPFKFVAILAPSDPQWYYDDYVVKINSGDKCQLISDLGGGSWLYCEEDVWENFLKKYIDESCFTGE